MSNLNQIVIEGNVVKDPIVKNVGNTDLITFRIACNEKYEKRDGTKVEETLFIDVENFSKYAKELAEFVVKGRKVVVSGNLKQDDWETKEGEKRSTYKIKAISVFPVESTKN